MEEKIRNFTDLVAWKEAHQLVLHIYKLTNKFPNEEKFGLVNQTRRAVVSITSNIAEGFGRNTAKDKSQFYSIAKGSLLEVQSQLLIAKDLEYIKDGGCKLLEENIIKVAKLLSGLMKSAASK